MNPVKVGLIGFGRMGGFYLDEMQKSGRWDVAYICDVCAESRDLARKLAPGAKVVDDEQVIFDDPEVQVVGLFALADSRKSQIERASPRASTSSPKNPFPTVSKTNGRPSSWPRTRPCSRR